MWKLRMTADGKSAYLIDPQGQIAGRWFQDRPDLTTFDPNAYMLGRGTPITGGTEYEVTRGPGVTEAPVAAPAAGGTNWDAYRGFFPDMSDAEWNAIKAAMPADLNVQEGFNWIQLAVQTGVETRQQDLTDAINQRNAAVNEKQLEINRQRAETERLYNMGLLEESRLSREQEAVLARELNALNREIAQMQHELGEAQLAQQEREYAAQLAAHPVNIVEYEMYKRGGGAPAVPAAAPTAAPTVPAAITPTAPAAAAPAAMATAAPAAYSPTTGGGIPVSPYGTQGASYRAGAPRARAGVLGAAKGKVVSPGLIQVGEKGWEYVQAPAGTVVAPHAKGEGRATMEGGSQAIQRQLGQTPRRRTRRPPVARMQYGGYTTPGSYTDPEMAAMFAGILGRGPQLYNPRLGGRGVFGSTIPSPGQVSRRLYQSFDPAQRDILESFIGAGIEMDGKRTAIYVPDWLQQMQRSWIPGLPGAGRSVEYQY